MLTNYAVPVAFINGDKLADIAMEYELERAPSHDVLLTAVVNREDVEALIKAPVRWEMFVQWANLPKNHQNLCSNPTIQISINLFIFILFFMVGDKFDSYCFICLQLYLNLFSWYSMGCFYNYTLSVFIILRLGLLYV